MEVFQPGGDYGNPRQHTVLVCINPQNRSFEQCDPAESVAVYKAFLSQVAMAGQNQKTLVATSGCVLGCKKDGATVTIISKGVGDQQDQVQYFRNVTVADVETLVNRYFCH